MTERRGKSQQLLTAMGWLDMWCDSFLNIWLSSIQVKLYTLDRRKRPHPEPYVLDRPSRASFPETGVRVSEGKQGQDASSPSKEGEQGKMHLPLLQTKEVPLFLSPSVHIFAFVRATGALSLGGLQGFGLWALGFVPVRTEDGNACRVSEAFTPHDVSRDLS